MKQILFIATMICSLAAFAEVIDVNGDFKKVKDGMPYDGWLPNQAAWAKPFGKIEMLEGALKITNTGKAKRTDAFTLFCYPIKAGDTVKITVKLKGKGKAGVGFYSYGDKEWCGAFFKHTTLKAKTTEFTANIIAKDRFNKAGKLVEAVENFKVALQAVGLGSEVIFKSVKVELIAAKQ